MKCNLKIFSLLIVLGALLVPPVLMATDKNAFTLDMLMQVLQQTADPIVNYTEEKSSEFLDINLLSKGTLSLDESGAMQKTVVGTVATSKMLVTDTELQIIRQGQEIKKISLQRYPAIKAFMAAFKATLQGDLDELQKYYNIELSGSMSDWHLYLTPANNILQKAVESIHIYGSKGKTKKYIVKEYRGDTSTLLIGEELS